MRKLISVGMILLMIASGFGFLMDSGPSLESSDGAEGEGSRSIYYVSPSDSWASIRTTIESATGTDTVEFSAGTYEMTLGITFAGTTTLTAIGDVFLIASGGNRLWNLSGESIVFDGFVLNNESNYRMIFIWSGDLSFIDCQLTQRVIIDTTTMGLLSFSGSSFRSNGIGHIDPTGTVTNFHADNSTFSFYPNTHALEFTCTNMEIDNCTIYLNSTYSTDRIIDQLTPTGLTVKNTVFSSSPWNGDYYVDANAGDVVMIDSSFSVVKPLGSGFTGVYSTGDVDLFGTSFDVENGAGMLVLVDAANIYHSGGVIDIDSSSTNYIRVYDASSSCTINNITATVIDDTLTSGGAFNWDKHISISNCSIDVNFDGPNGVKAYYIADSDLILDTDEYGIFSLVSLTIKNSTINSTCDNANVKTVYAQFGVHVSDSNITGTTTDTGTGNLNGFDCASVFMNNSALSVDSIVGNGIASGDVFLYNSDFDIEFSLISAMASGILCVALTMDNVSMDVVAQDEIQGIYVYGPAFIGNSTINIDAYEGFVVKTTAVPSRVSNTSINATFGQTGNENSVGIYGPGSINPFYVENTVINMDSPSGTLMGIFTDCLVAENVSISIEDELGGIYGIKSGTTTINDSSVYVYSNGTGGNSAVGIMSWNPFLIENTTVEAIKQNNAKPLEISSAFGEIKNCHFEGHGEITRIEVEGHVGGDIIISNSTFDLYSNDTDFDDSIFYNLDETIFFDNVSIACNMEFYQYNMSVFHVDGDEVVLNFNNCDIDVPGNLTDDCNFLVVENGETYGVNVTLWGSTIDDDLYFIVENDGADVDFLGSPGPGRCSAGDIEFFGLFSITAPGVDAVDVDIFYQGASSAIDSGTISASAYAYPVYLLHSSVDAGNSTTPQYYDVEMELPLGWNIGDASILAQENNTALAQTGTIQIEFACQPGLHLVYDSGAEEEVIITFTDSNSTLVDDIVPGEEITTDRLIMISNMMDLDFRLFYLQFGNWTGPNGIIDMAIYTAQIYEGVVLVHEIETVNGTVYFSDSLTFGETFGITLVFDSPPYVESGVYTSEYVFTLYNSTENLQTGAVSAWVPEVPVIAETYTLGQGEVRYGVGIQGGITGNIFSTNEAVVNNAGNSIIRRVEFSAVSVMTCTVAPFDSFTLIDRFTVVDFNDLLGPSFTWDGSTAMTFDYLIGINIGWHKDYRFGISDTPLTASGTYRGTISVVGITTAGVRSPAVEYDHEIIISASSVAVTLGYTYDDPEVPNPEVDPKGLQFPPLIPGGSGFRTENWCILENVGTLDIHTLVFAFTDLVSGVESIEIGGNGWCIDQTEGVSDIPAIGGPVSYSVLMVPGDTLQFRVLIDQIEENQPALSYSGSFTVVATYLAGSRADGDFSTTLIGEMGSPGEGAGFVEFDNSEIGFLPPLHEGLGANVSTSIRNIWGGGLISLSFLMDGMPANYYLQVGAETFFPEGGRVEVSFADPLGFWEIVEVQWFVYTVHPNYNTSQNYTDQIEVRGSIFTGVPGGESVVLGEIGVTVGELPGIIIEVEAGITYACVPVDAVVHASDITGTMGVGWVASWTGSGYQYYYDAGQNPDFVIEYGEGFVIFSALSVEIEFIGEVPFPVEISIEAGLSFVGNPQSTELNASAYSDASPSINYMAQWNGAGFTYYYPPSGMGENFTIPAYGGVFVQSAEAETISYGGRI